MTDKETELCKDIGREILIARESYSDDAFIVAPEQMLKFNKVVEYAKMLAEEHNGVVEYCNTKPRDTIGAIAVRFSGELTLGERHSEIASLIKSLNLCDGINIEGTGLEDGSFIVTFYVLDVHVKKG